MDLNKIRDELNIQKGAYNEAVKNNKLATNELMEILKSFTQEDLELLKKFGISSDFFSSIDTEKLTTDEDYLKEVSSTLKNVADSLETSLKLSLNLE